jgi:pimeloyl-ACP methyl ester carboxylesterase
MPTLAWRKALTFALLAFLALAVVSSCSAKPTFRRSVAPGTTPVVLVHGYSFGTACPGYNVASYWAGPMAALRASWKGPVTAVDFYQCDVGGQAISAYSRDEPIDGLALALDHYLEQNRFVDGVDLVGHSMGGLIIAAMIRDISVSAPGFVPVPARVAITISTPFAGVPASVLRAYGCSGNTQCSQVSAGSSFLAGLAQAPRSSTRWTTTGGGTCDLVSAASANAMTEAVRIAWSKPCYTHTGILGDQATGTDSSAAFQQLGQPVRQSHNALHSLQFLLLALADPAW